MIRDTSGHGNLTFAFATPPRGGIDPARMPETTRGTREAPRSGKFDGASSTERPEAQGFGERIAQARRDAERESARRVQSKVEQRAGDRSERSAHASAARQSTDAETRRTSEPDRRDAPDTAAHAGAAASNGSAPPEASHATPQAATQPASHAASDAANRARATVIAANTASAANANPSVHAANGTYAANGIHAASGSDASNDASQGADTDLASSANGDPGASGDPASIGDHSAALSDAAAASSILWDPDPATGGVRRGASGHDPADVASRLAQAADNAAMVAAGHAPAASGTPGTAHTGTAAMAGSAPIHVGGIATPLADPAFAGHLAGETLQLAIAGVEHAEISVQPKDLGPIRIELSLNGESARIAFTATQPDTRLAIEQSLPILEEMLAEHGLLLADANVSDQRGGDADDGKDTGRASGFDPDSSSERGYGASGLEGTGSRTADGAASGATIRRGLVDLYA